MIYKLLNYVVISLFHPRMITFFFKEALVFYLAPHLSFITDQHLETDLNIHCFSGE